MPYSGKVLSAPGNRGKLQEEKGMYCLDPDEFLTTRSYLRVVEECLAAMEAALGTPEGVRYAARAARAEEAYERMDREGGY